jgi:hypothetical protein
VTFHSGIKEFNRKKVMPLYPSGNKYVDQLLKGGFQKEFIYLLYGDRKILVDILLSTAVYSFKDKNFEKRVAFVDCNNRFNPYKVSKLAVKEGLSPKAVLEHILISRAFTWEQMVELLENRLSQLDHIKMVMVSGISRLWPNYNKKTFEGMLAALNGVKKTIFRTNPVMILTAPLHEISEFKPKGGRYLTHFGSVLLLIKEDERKIEYSLIQHPFQPENVLIRYKPRRPKRKIPTKNSTIDLWFNIK